MRIKITRDMAKKFRYIWLKEVAGTNLNQHCAHSLVGQYVEVVNQYTRCETLNLEGDVYYLCGVSMPYTWENNAHIAFRKKLGASFKFENNGLAVEAEDAELIPIDDTFVDKNLPVSHKKEFYTCRNWQFANWFKKEYGR